jgi:prevent-host-death family protein
VTRRGSRSPDTVPAARFKARCLELMEEVRERRTEYVITKRGKPVAKLAPCDDVAADAFGMLAGSILGYDDIVSPDPGAWGKE